MNDQNAGKFLPTVTEGVVQGVYKVLTQSSFSATWRHKARGGKWTFCHCLLSQKACSILGSSSGNE